MIKCVCGKPECPIQIIVSGYGHELWITDKAGMETLMYVDANTIVALIKELRRALIEIADETIERD